MNLPIYRNCRLLTILSFLCLISCTSKSPENKKSEEGDNYAGSESCIECHEHFYELWSPSHHGKAMQPITSEFINTALILEQDPIVMEGATYQAVLKDGNLYIHEVKNNVDTDYEVLWALGGKNVFYFLTPWEGGRLQTLPLAYDVHTRLWYNNPESAVRHFPNMNGGAVEDQALSWKDLQYTFNTSCYSCHVSQLENNFDLETNTYQTHWKEAGINCETCHGPAQKHIKSARLAEIKKIKLDSVHLVVTSQFTPEQHNSSCGGCHAKMNPITASYYPGDSFFDNFDLITLENSDFYPDGRDLGENYTMTSWFMNSCTTQSDLHCITCHTSSGRYRFKSDDLLTGNKACTSCHEEKEEGYAGHTHHKINQNSPKCIDCHMPLTRFGNMNRSDHSFRPPMPAASLKFGSPNACIICHTDKSNQWANANVIKWNGGDYQKKTLEAGQLILEARNNEWKNLDLMLEVVRTNKYGEVFTNSFIRLLENCPNEKKWVAFMEAVKHNSPLVRSAALLGLSGNYSDDVKKVMFQAADEEYRLVRLAAVQVLALFPPSDFTSQQREIFQQVNLEYEQSLVAHPDNWSSYYNLGNHYQNMGNLQQALSAYETSLKINSDAILPLVNSSFLYSISGNNQKAVDFLEQALVIDPKNEAANLNYGLIMAELNQMELAESALRTVMEVNRENATAAYNLSIMVSSRDLNEACQLSQMAMDSSPGEPKYAYTYAYFLNLNKQQDKAITILKQTTKAFPDHLPSVFLLGNIILESGNRNEVIDLYTGTMQHLPTDAQAQYQIKREIERIRLLQ